MSVHTWEHLMSVLIIQSNEQLYFYESSPK